MKNNFLKNINFFDSRIVLVYLGQVGFLIKAGAQHILIDPYLTDYVDRNCSNEQVKWKRNYPSPISPNEFDFVDYVFCTHTHYDHADPETLSAIAMVNPKVKFVVPQPTITKFLCCGIDEKKIIGVKCDEKISLDTFSFTAIPSAHETLHPDHMGGYDEVGYRFDFSGITLYHAGDGCMWDGLEKRIAGTDIMILPVNGRDWYRTNVLDIIGCFDSTEAITLAKRCGADLLIPTHFDLYPINSINPAEFVDKLYKINREQKFHIFAPGEKYIYEKTNRGVI